MKRFGKWLESRDHSLVEEISAEDMKRHDFDAMQYAQQTLKTHKERSEQQEAVKNLETIKNHLQDWVGHDKFGAAKLKYIAAIIQTHGKDQFPHHAYAELDDLHKVAKLLGKDELEKAIGEKEVLKQIAHAVESDWDTEIWPSIHDKQASDLYGNDTDAVEQPDVPGMEDHSHGDLGKHFADFTVAHMLHLINKLQHSLKQKHDDEDKVKMGVDKPIQPHDPTPSPASDAQKQDGQEKPKQGGDNVMMPPQHSEN